MSPSKPISRLAASLISILLLDGVQGQAETVLNNTQAYTGFPPCDALIVANLSHAVVLPSSPLYPSLLAGYWSLNTRKSPWCFVRPSTPSEVSQTITALRQAGDGAGDWSVAIRSGGHGSDHSNNIDTGVTIDLSQLNSTTYNAVTKVASVGTGALWQSVYDTLDGYGVGVTGGREGVVGVGGFALGGGNSYYTAKTGFTCDTVVNYEVVLASGEIINANASTNSDLWQALKGGSSNFGIVTRFDLEAFPAQNLTFETRVIGIKHADEVMDAVVDFANLDQSFHDNAMLTSVTYSPQAAGITIAVIEVNTANDGNSTAFSNFNRIPTLAPTVQQSLTQAQSANKTAVAPNTLNVGSTLTIANDKRVLKYCIEQHAALVALLNSTLGAKAFSTILEIQPLPAYFAKVSLEKGGNMLGLSPHARNKLLFVAGVTLLGPNSQNQYPIAYQQALAMVERIEAYSKSIGSAENFIYLNYAHAPQNPLGSYGAASVKHMKKAAQKYDPHGVFQRMVPGGFKIDRAVNRIP